MPRAIDVTPAVGLQGEVLRIHLTGFASAERIQLTTRMTTRDGTLWRSQATFIADPNGAVDAATSPSVDGSYRGVAAMGPIWSMQRDASSPQDRQRLAIRDPVSISFAATSADGTTAQTKVLRQLAADGVTFRPIDDSKHRLRGGWWLPVGAGPHSAPLSVFNLRVLRVAPCFLAVRPIPLSLTSKTLVSPASACEA